MSTGSTFHQRVTEHNTAHKYVSKYYGALGSKNMDCLAPYSRAVNSNTIVMLSETGADLISVLYWF